MQAKYPILPEFAALKRFSFLKSSFMLKIANAVLALTFAVVPARGTRVKRMRTAGGVKLFVFEPLNRQGNLPCLFFCHGGGFILRTSFSHKLTARDLAVEAGCIVVMPEYRLAPKHPFPAAYDDCREALLWVWNNAEALSIERDSLVVYGDSAGGNLAAALAISCRDEGGAKIRGQFLNYPVTDDRMATESMKRYPDTPGWDSGLNSFMWGVYLANGAGDKPQYAAPLRAKDLSGLPAARVEVAQFDCLRDEGIAYAERLKQGGVETELFELKNAPHGYDLARKAPCVRENFENRVASIRRAFSK